MLKKYNEMAECYRPKITTRKRMKKVLRIIPPGWLTHAGADVKSFSVIFTFWGFININLVRERLVVTSFTQVIFLVSVIQVGLVYVALLS